MDKNRPVFRPQPSNPAAAPTLVRVPRDAQLFRGWGITL